MSNKPRKKKNNNHKRGIHQLTGLNIAWDDNNPLSEEPLILNQVVTHSNSVYRHMAKSIWRAYKKQIIEKLVLLWRVDITVIFEYPDGTIQNEARRVVSRARLSDISDACEDLIRNLHKFGDNPQVTKFNCLCLGDRASTESDFGNFE